MWEEFTQSIHSFIEDKKNLALHTQGKKKANPIVILSIRFTKLIIHYLQSKHKFHPRLDSPLHLPYEEYVLGYLKFSAKGTKREVFGMPIPNDLITDDIRGEQYHNVYLEKVVKHQRYLVGKKGSDPDSPAPKPATATKPEATKKSKPSTPKAAPITKPTATKASKSTSSQQSKPAPVKPQEKKQKLVMETSEAPSQARRSKADEGILVNEPRFDNEEVDMQKAVEESLKDVHAAHRGPLPPVVFREPDFGRRQPLLEVQGHDESSSLYAELGLTDSETKSDEEVLSVIKSGVQDGGQARLNPGVHDEGQAGPNPGDDAESQPKSSLVVHAGPNLEHIDFEATDASTQQNLEQMDEGFIATAYPKVQENLKLTVEEHVILEELASSTGTFTTDSILIKRISELEQHMADLIQDNLALEERMDKHGSRLYKLNNLDIPYQVSKAVDEIVTDAVDWSIQALLWDRFRDFTEADMKEILHHRMWETNSYKAHEDHKKLYEALEKSMDRDHSDQLLTDLVEARRKKKKRHDLPKTPPGSPPHQPPLLHYLQTTTDTRLKPSVSSIPEDLHIDDDTAPDEQVHSSDDEDIGNDHIPKVNLMQDWWKPLSKEDRHATPEPAWSIPSSDLPVPMNNWASALTSTYAPPPENSLLALTGDMAIFMDWYCKQQRITELTQKDLEGPAFEIVKVFHPNVIHLQYQMEKCHKLLTDQADNAIIRYNVNKPLPLGSQPGQVTIQADFFFNKDLEYLRYGSKGGRPALSMIGINLHKT
ncbi:hypothetical protein Tco_0098520 [Tanacetum coccineum]